MDILLVSPILISFGTAILCILVWSFGFGIHIQRGLAVGGMLCLLIASLLLLRTVREDGIQVTHMGNWDAPFGIVLVADLFSAIMVTITGILGFSIAVYSLGSIDRDREHYGYYPLYCIMIMGVCGAFLTGDIFNLYVWFEVLLMSSFVLLALGGEKAQLSGAIQYVTMNLLSSTLFLVSAGMLYSITGTLNMADLALQIENVKQPGLLTALAVMFLVAFGIKAAIFPLFFWLPVSYHTPPVSVSAIFAGLLTKVGAYALIRVFTLIFIHDVEFTHPLILILSGATMVSGVLGAAAEYEFRRILSFHIVSQIGYIIMGLGLFTPLALAGSVYFLIHNILAKTNLFLVSGISNRLRGSYELKDLGGLYKSHPFLSVLYLIPALALAGIPPLSGFWGKFILVRAGMETESYIIVGVALFVSVWTLYSMIKIWAEVFLKAPPKNVEVMVAAPTNGNIWFMLLPVIALAALTVLMGLFAEPIFVLARDTGHQLLDRSEYIEAVLGSNQ
jgi:multicomponent Na+:H+ antiporter subunit D